jgi:hypothetical protein
MAHGARQRPTRPRPLSMAGARAYYGGQFPDVHGRRYRYPRPDEARAWTALLNRARLARYREELALFEGRRPPRDPLRSKHEYVLYHCRKRDRWQRAVRNRHRAMHGLKRGDPRVVHHLDPRSMAFEKTVVLDHCQHQRVHGKHCRRPRR